MSDQMSDSPEQSKAVEEFNEAADIESGGASVGKLLTKLSMSLLFVVVLGAASALGAITLKPELVEYLSFIPSMGNAGKSACSYSAASAGCCSVAEDGASACCGAEGTCGEFSYVEPGCEANCEVACSAAAEVESVEAVTGESEASEIAAE